MTHDVENMLEEIGSAQAPPPSPRFADSLESDLRVMIATSSSTGASSRLGRWPATVAAAGFTVAVVVFALATLAKGPTQVYVSQASDTEVILPTGERFEATSGVALPSGAVLSVGENGSVTVGDKTFGPETNLVVEGDEVEEVGDDIAAVIEELPTTTLVAPTRGSGETITVDSRDRSGSDGGIDPATSTSSSTIATTEPPQPTTTSVSTTFVDVSPESTTTIDPATTVVSPTTSMVVTTAPSTSAPTTVVSTSSSVPTATTIDVTGTTTSTTTFDHSDTTTTDPSDSTSTTTTTTTTSTTTTTTTTTTTEPSDTTTTTVVGAGAELSLNQSSRADLLPRAEAWVMAQRTELDGCVTGCWATTKYVVGLRTKRRYL
ncbi:MAG: hypothetical protein GY708_16260 [Actinomycetia bacterium]|nr:hypothetical protein [Actinomycetes bacterium]